MPAKQKKDRSHKRHVPRKLNDMKLRHQPWRLVGVFQPLLALADQLENHHAITVENDVPVFRDINDGKLYEVQPAMSGFISLFELFEVRYAKPLPLDPLRVLLGKVMDDQAVIHSDDTQAVRASIDVLRKAMLELTHGQADELLNDYKLSEALNGNIID